MSAPSPFSNGSEAMHWYENNCDKCKKSYSEYPDPAETEELVEAGAYCSLQWTLEKAQWDDFDDSCLDGPNGIGRLLGNPSYPAWRCQQFVDWRAASTEKIQVSENQEKLF